MCRIDMGTYELDLGILGLWKAPLLITEYEVEWDEDTGSYRICSVDIQTGPLVCLDNTNLTLDEPIIQDLVLDYFHEVHIEEIFEACLEDRRGDY